MTSRAWVLWPALSSLGCADGRAVARNHEGQAARSAPATVWAGADQRPDGAGLPPDAGPAAPLEVVRLTPTAAEPMRLPDGAEVAACAPAPPNMACIAGGPFTRGSDDGPKNARPAAQIALQTFYMDVFEVTYAQYKACEASGACPRSGPRYTDFDHPNIPIQGVSWFDAVAFCTAQAKHLPSEAQWEKAARGPDGDLHSWGNDPATCERAIIRDAAGRSCGLRKQKSKPDVGRPWDVGSRPAGAYGLYDMNGNAWEWVSDWYARDYAECGEACTGVDPLGPCGGAAVCAGHRLKIVRGGSWYWEGAKATSVYRRSHFPSNKPFHHFGFRCAASTEEAAGLSAPEPG